jgi:dienelactone hydrolase
VFGIAGDRWQAFGPALARRGWVVLAPDSVAFEDRRRSGTGREPRPADIVASARSQFAALGAAANLSHLRFPGGHPLNRASYQAIVDWITAN